VPSFHGAGSNTGASAWLQAHKDKKPYECLEYFAKAVEVDELGCGWKAKFESKLEEIGDFFTLPPKVADLPALPACA
jgi:hypothetical protein